MSLYVTTHPQPQTYTPSLEDVLLGLIDDVHLAQIGRAISPTTTRTYKYNYRTSTFYYNRQTYAKWAADYIKPLEDFYERWRHYDVFFDPAYNYGRQLAVRKQVEREMRKATTNPYAYIAPAEIDAETERRLAAEGLKFNQYYSTFYIPKRSGSGLRQIDAPCEGLKTALRELAGILATMMGGNSYHTSAYAYISGRSRVDLVKKLRNNKSRWILKLDFSNFFGSITLDWTLKQLEQIFPFNTLLSDQRGKEILESCLRLCFLDGRLPQGTPISPMLTNILMIPIDYEITNAFLHDAKNITEFDKEGENDNYRLIYTRYADDLFIGSHRGFKYKPVIQHIQDVLAQFDAPIQLNIKKTHYGSTAGQNWILGMMYTSDYRITIGAKKKAMIKTMIHHFAEDYKNGREIDASDMLVALGQISHLAHIEPEYAEQLLERCNAKYQIDVCAAMKEVAYTA